MRLIDPPIHPWSSIAEIEAWLEKLRSMPQGEEVLWEIWRTERLLKKRTETVAKANQDS